MEVLIQAQNDVVFSPMACTTERKGGGVLVEDLSTGLCHTFKVIVHSKEGAFCVEVF